MAVVVTSKSDYIDVGGDDLDHLEIMRCMNEASQADYQNRLDALEDLRFAANENGNGQWDPEVLRERIEQGRPVITVNLIPQFVHQVTNDARINRPAIKVRPVDDDADPKTAEVLEGIIRHIEDQSEADSKAYIPALDSAAKCGMGAFRVTADYVSDISRNQDLFIKGVTNALGVLWDPSSKDPTRMDARYCALLEDISKSEYKTRWPDAAIADVSVANTGEIQWAQDDTVRIAEYWYKEPTTKVLAFTEDGKTLDITKVPKAALRFLPPNKTRKVKTYKICQYIVSGSQILEGPNEWPGKYIPIIPVIGEETYVGENRVRSGIIRNAKDPQRLYNLWRSNQAEIIGLQPKSPYVGTFKQFEKYRAIWQQANRRNLPYLPYDADPQAPGPPRREQPPVASSAMAEEIAIAANEMRSTTGIYDSGLGQHSSNAVSGKAIGELKAQSSLATAHFSDGLQLAIRHCGRILIDLIPTYYDTERTVRLLNEDGTDQFERINSTVMTPDGPQVLHDLSLGTYDVTVTVGPAYATRRQEASASMMQLIQTAPEMAASIIDIIARNQDWPGADEISDRFHKLVLAQHPEFADPKKDKPQQPSQKDQMNAMMARLELRTKSADADKAEADARLAEAQADDAEMDTTIKAIAVDAATKTHHMQVESVILKELMDVITRGQAALQPAQPGQGGNAQMPQQAAPAGAQ